jgi:predicted ribosomally synthesized peptide with SipW-like signal peptide/uncharacterized repeat protein (TIGR01451 family)
MRKILLSLMTIGIAATLLGAGTLSYFYDIEVSTDNYFEAGKLDLKIDVDSYWWRDWPDPYLMGEIHFPYTDLTDEKFFDWDDVKPGDHGEATISIHVFDNDAWLWLHLADVHNDDNGLTEPEMNHPTDGDLTGGPGEGELAENMWVMIWCDDGDNIWEDGEEIWHEGWMSEIIGLYECCWLGPFYVEACEDYYIGWSWRIPSFVGNVIQSDSLDFDLEFRADQHRNNPNPTPPGELCEPGEADVEIFKEATNTQPVGDEPFDFIVTVHNRGPDKAKGIVVYDMLPDELTLTGWTESQGTYDPATGEWHVGDLEFCDTATLTLNVFVSTYDPTADFTQLGFILDGSGSIDAANFTLMLNGIITALRDECIPNDGSVELTIVQFGDYTTTVEIGPIVITDTPGTLGYYLDVAANVSLITQIGSMTPMGDGFRACADAMYASPLFDAGNRQVINLVTDGEPTEPSADPYGDAIAGRNYLIQTLQMTADQDEIDAEAVGAFATPDWLRENIVWPGQYWWPPIGPGWVRNVTGYQEFADTICEKMSVIFAITNRAIIVETYTDDLNPTNDIATATVHPIPT